MEAKYRRGIILFVVAIVLCLLAVLATYFFTRLGPPVDIPSPRPRERLSRESVTKRIAGLAEAPGAFVGRNTVVCCLKDSILLPKEH